MMDTSDTQLNSVSTPITRMEVMAVMGKGPIPTLTFYLAINAFVSQIYYTFLFLSSLETLPTVKI